MKALWMAVAFSGLVMACSGGTGPVVVAEPGPGAGESPAPDPGKGAKDIMKAPGGSSREQAIQKLEDECRLPSGVLVPLGNGATARTSGSDSNTLSDCAAECVLDSSCDEITDRDEDNGYFDCVSVCPR